MEEVILRYVEPIYRFCCKRLSSPVDAEDLSQEILLCILQGMRHAKINNMDGYVWKIAHNRYARMMEVKKRDVAVLCGDRSLPGFPTKLRKMTPTNTRRYFMRFIPSAKPIAAFWWTFM